MHTLGRAGTGTGSTHTLPVPGWYTFCEHEVCQSRCLRRQRFDTKTTAVPPRYKNIRTPSRRKKRSNNFFQHALYCSWNTCHPSDKTKFMTVLNNAVMDPSDAFAVSRVLMTTQMTFDDGTRLPRLCSLPCYSELAVVWKSYLFCEHLILCCEHLFALRKNESPCNAEVAGRLIRTVHQPRCEAAAKWRRVGAQCAPTDAL